MPLGNLGKNITQQGNFLRAVDERCPHQSLLQPRQIRVNGNRPQLCLGFPP